MKKLVNTAASALKFKLAGTEYSVPVGGTCEVPEKLMYAVVARGLPLKEWTPPKVVVAESKTVKK